MAASEKMTDEAIQCKANRWRDLYSEMLAIQKQLLEQEGLTLRYLNAPSSSFTKDPADYTFYSKVEIVRKF